MMHTLKKAQSEILMESGICQDLEKNEIGRAGLKTTLGIRLLGAGTWEEVFFVGYL